MRIRVENPERFWRDHGAFIKLPESLGKARKKNIISGTAQSTNRAESFSCGPKEPAG